MMTLLYICSVRHVVHVAIETCRSGNTSVPGYYYHRNSSVIYEFRVESFVESILGSTVMNNNEMLMRYEYIARLTASFIVNFCFVIYIYYIVILSFYHQIYSELLT